MMKVRARYHSVKGFVCQDTRSEAPALVPRLSRRPPYDHADQRGRRRAGADPDPFIEVDAAVARPRLQKRYLETMAGLCNFKRVPNP